MNTRKITALAGTVVLAALTLTGCAVDTIDEKPTAAAPAADKGESNTPAPPPPAETKEPEQGTRTNPFPKGTTVGTEEVSLTLGEVTWNATDIIAGENQFNDPAPAGTTYALLPVTITNVSNPDAVTPWLAFDITFVADDGRSFEEASVVIPGELTDIADLYPGGVAQGNIAFALPNEVSGGGVWAIEETFGFGEPVFIAAH